MGKVNKNDYFSLLIKQNLMDTEESVMRTFKANKMKGFFTYQAVTLWNLLL